VNGRPIPIPGREEEFGPAEVEREAEGVPELHEVDCPDELREEIETAVSRYPEVRSASLPALWAVQRYHGWCSPEGIRQAAAVMGVTPAFLEGVATFYDLLHLEPIGRHRVLVCTNLSCWMSGADELLDAFCAASGADPHEAAHGGSTTGDGELFVSAFAGCLGACDIAPMASIDERYYGPLAVDDAPTVVDQLRSGTDPLPEKAIARRPAAGGPDHPPDPRVEQGGG
jgi:NADH-quinone oxidoreductase subunit E